MIMTQIVNEMRRLPLIITGLILAGALTCCKRTPEGVLPQEKMAELIADIHVGESVAEATPGSFPNDSTKRALRQAIYARHGLTPEQAEASLRWYGYNMERYIEVYDRAIEILNERMRDAELLAGTSGSNPASTPQNNLTLEGDSVDVWNGITFRPFSSELLSNVIPFSMLHDINWEKGDIYYLRSKLTGNSGPVVFTVAIDYDDGSKETFSNRMIGDGWHDVSFGLDTVRTARQIYGTISYQVPDGETAYIDSVSLTRARWSTGKFTPRNEMKKLSNKRHSPIYD